MKSRLHIEITSWLAVPLGALIGALTLGYTFVNESPHNFSSGECFGCHFTLPEPGDIMPHRFTGNISVLCTRCHEIDPSSHVVDVVPLIGVPPGMPLSDTGTITCGTCHDPHTNAADPATGEKTYFLRQSGPGQEFCLLCHEDPVFLGKVSIFSAEGRVTHRRSMTRAHGFAHLDVVDYTQELDPLSVTCIGCHDAGEAEPDPQLLGMGIWEHGGGIGLTHPIGINYAGEARKHDDLVREYGLDPRLILFDGKIGCCTCHNMYKEGGGMGLAIGDEGHYQDLCLGCHIK